MPQVLLKEVSSYETSVQSVERKAQELVDSDHFAAEDISEQMANLQRQWRELQLVSGRRTQKLSDALEAQKVYTYTHAHFVKLESLRKEGSDFRPLDCLHNIHQPHFLKRLTLQL